MKGYNMAKKNSSLAEVTSKTLWVYFDLCSFYRRGRNQKGGWQGGKVDKAECIIDVL